VGAFHQPSRVTRPGDGLLASGMTHFRQSLEVPCPTSRPFETKPRAVRIGNLPARFPSRVLADRGAESLGLSASRSCDIRWRSELESRFRTPRPNGHYRLHPVCSVAWESEPHQDRRLGQPKARRSRSLLTSPSSRMPPSRALLPDCLPHRRASTRFRFSPACCTLQSGTGASMKLLAMSTGARMNARFRGIGQVHAPPAAPRYHAGDQIPGR